MVSVLGDTQKGTHKQTVWSPPRVQIWVFMNQLKKNGTGFKNVVQVTEFPFLCHTLLPKGQDHNIT